MAAPAPASRLPLIRLPGLLLAALLMAAMGTGCRTPVSPPAPGTIEDLRTTLLETDRAFCRMALERGLADAFFEFLVDDAVWLPNGSEPVLGREAVRAELRAAAATQLVWEPQFADVARSGDLGYTWGLYESRFRGTDGRERVSRGKYTTIWRRQPDRTWRAVLDTGNPSVLLTP